MNIALFDPDADWIMVDGRASGPRGNAPLRLLVDTAATVTTLIPDVLDLVGYSARDGFKRTVIQSAVSAEPGFLVRIAEFECFGFMQPDFEIHAHDLPDGFDNMGSSASISCAISTTRSARAKVAFSSSRHRLRR